jgi:hypothetical protein
MIRGGFCTARRKRRSKPPTRRRSEFGVNPRRVDPLKRTSRIQQSSGAVAQLGERRVRNAEVRGSIPLGSNFILRLVPRIKNTSQILGILSRAQGARGGVRTLIVRQGLRRIMQSGGHLQVGECDWWLGTCPCASPCGLTLLAAFLQGLNVALRRCALLMRNVIFHGVHLEKVPW